MSEPHFLDDDDLFGPVRQRRSARLIAISRAEASALAKLSPELRVAPRRPRRKSRARRLPRPALGRAVREILDDMRAELIQGVDAPDAQKASA